MRILIAFAILLSTSPCLHAQSGKDTISLNEVTVKAAKVINKVDGLIIYPTEAQKTSSTNGYNFLQKLALPNLRIDNIAHSISVLDNRGGVQLRINGIIADTQAMLALNPKRIRKIDFINNPGVRYGDGIAYVINILTTRSDNGYTLGADATTALTTPYGSGTAYGQWNFGKSELSMSYYFYGRRQTGIRNSETADYTLNDGTIHTLSRDDLETRRKNLMHNVKLTYNLADTTAYVFQVSLSESLQRMPENSSLKRIVDGSDSYTATSREQQRSHSPILDLYFFRQITPHQSITANVVGTYISTDKDSYYDERTPYAYHVDGKTESILSEVIYENRLKPFTLSAGINHRYKYTRNLYSGDATSLAKMRQNTLYAFSEIAGSLQQLRYALGLGGSYLHYRQGSHSYNFQTLKPKATLSYPIARGLQLRYVYQLSERVSRVAMVSDAVIRTNSMEWTIGNPSLKPSRDTQHQLQLSYNTPRLNTFVEGIYKQCDKPNMAYYERTEDNRFIYTQCNQKGIDVLNLTAYAGYWLLPERLQIAVDGGLMRCFNYGNDYTHLYTSWFYAAQINAYLGKFTLSAYVDNGSRFLEGENKGYNGATTQLQAAYQHKDWQFSLTWSNLFRNPYKFYQSELLNRNLHKLATGYSKDDGNLVTLNITWRLSRGKKHRAADKSIHLKDGDAGIL